MEEMQLPKKNKNESPIDLPEIPDEIIHTHILSRLPVKTLLQFRSVCKRWRQWISNPQFKISTQRRRILIFDKKHIRSDLSNPPPLPCIYEEDGSLHSIPEPTKGPPSTHLLGSCNGFVLIGRETSIFLWNPSTRACTKVLEHNDLFHCYIKNRHVMTGLCYDSRTDDYKVLIRLNHLAGQPFEFSSLRRKCWKKVDNFPSYHFIIKGQSCGAVVNGNQHWLVKKKLNFPREWNNSEEAIIYFDGGCEKFNEIQIPTPTNGGNDAYCGLGELDGCLALSQHGNDRGSTIKIWVMKDYNIVKSSSSWSLCFKFSVFVRWEYNYRFALQPLCITKKGDEVLMVKDGKEIYVLSLENESSQSIRTYDIKHPIEVAQYVESLASPSVETTPELI